MALSLKFSVRTKILSGFVLVFILCLSVLVYCLVQMRQIQWQLTIVQEGYLPLTRDVSRIENNQQGMERYLDPDRLTSRDKLPTNLYLSLALFHLNRIEESLRLGHRRVEQTLALPGVNIERRALTIIRDKFHTIEVEYQAYSALSREILSLLESGRGEEARALLPRLREQMVRVSRPIRDLSELLDQRVEAAVELTRDRQERAALMVASLSGAAIIFGTIMILVTHLVLRPISRLTEGVKFIAGGDYNQRVAIEADDEIGTLAREFNVMAASLEERDQSLKRSQVDLEQAYDKLKHAHGDLKTLSLYNENIIHSIEVGLIVCTREGTLTTLNRAATVLWGIDPKAVIGQPVRAVGRLEAVADLPGEVLESGRIVRRDAVELSSPDGSSRLLDSTFVPLLDDQAAVQGVIILSEDVTERTRTKQRLIQSERLALIGRMSAQVTHEIRNPLNALGLNAELLGDELETLDPEHKTDARQLLQSVTMEIDRLTEVTESYLRLARLPTPRLERENVGGIVESLLSFLREELSTRHIAVRCEIEPDLPEALVDDNQLRQALLNILRNSGEAMGEGGELRVQVIRLASGLEVVIQDNGEGIDPVILGQIWDPFYSTKATGTGLGLPITQQIIEEHGGSIQCESQRGVGTTFRIRLPAAAPDPTPQPIAA